ncbi:FeoC-like transcriptional regulator [Oxynema sp. CENA135]|uniref:FeoC-like transcriptional regulator n=1 Tax=Oxynema sp. CENA135 TaxID=984206 RepID=UPI00190BD815|nr:FeoC-like transcriptional regulator [Oxynema sp. CENA135]MBK4730532.1 FeoC-like transcriptional regulator [Oxynema sp. CENA135]
MILRDLQVYLAEQHTASLAQLSTHFHVEAAALEPMLKKLVRKGRVRQLPPPKPCGECTQCDRTVFDVYEWV